MDRFEAAQLNLRMIDQMVAEQLLRPEQSIKVVYSLEEDTMHHISRFGLYVRHFEEGGIWNIELQDIAETIRDPRVEPADSLRELLAAAFDNTDEAWDSINKNSVRVPLNRQTVVRWLGDLVAPVFSLY